MFNINEQNLFYPHIMQVIGENVFLIRSKYFVRNFNNSSGDPWNVSHKPRGFCIYCFFFRGRSAEFQGDQGVETYRTSIRASSSSKIIVFVTTNSLVLF